MFNFTIGKLHTLNRAKIVFLHDALYTYDGRMIVGSGTRRPGMGLITGVAMVRDFMPADRKGYVVLTSRAQAMGSLAQRKTSR
jgi:hypothetical protein